MYMQSSLSQIEHKLWELGNVLAVLLGKCVLVK